MSNMDKGKFKTIRKDILDDLSSRFVINIPAEERGDVTRICFQMELAYWFYLDFYCTKDESLCKSGLKDFFFQMFHHIPSLTHLACRIDLILDDWRTYKMAVPTFGAILIDESLTHVLLVQSFFAKASWGFPKGKVNQDENPLNCAVREVLEETGFDASHLIREDSFLEATYNDQLTRLYLVPGVPHAFRFKPQTRNEIKACQWFPIEEIPAHRKEVKTVHVSGVAVGTNGFFMIMPFIKRIKRFVQDQARARARGRGGGKARVKSLSEVEPEADAPRPTPPAAPVRCLDLEEAMMTSEKARPTSASVKKRLFYQPGPLDNYSTMPLSVTPSLPKSPGVASKTKDKLAKYAHKHSKTQEKASPFCPKEKASPFCPKEWRDFQFDVEAIMKCFSS